MIERNVSRCCDGGATRGDVRSTIHAEPRPVLPPSALFPSAADPMDVVVKTMKLEFRDMKKSHMYLEEKVRERLDQIEGSLINVVEMLKDGAGPNKPPSPGSGRQMSVFVPYELDNVNGSPSANGRVSDTSALRPNGPVHVLAHAEKVEKRAQKRKSQTPKVMAFEASQVQNGNGVNGKKKISDKETEALKVVKARGGLNKNDGVKLDSTSFLAPIAGHQWFDSIIATVVMASAVLVGLQINNDAVRHTEYKPYTYLEYTFSLIFTVELAMRIIALKKQFCASSIRIWSCFDVTLVFISWVDVCMKVIGGGKTLPGPGASIAKLIKMARMARIVRILRMVKWLAKVRIMSTMIVGSMTSLFWLFVLIMGVMYLFALVLTQGCTDWIRPPTGDEPRGHEDYDYMKESYGTVLRSIYTLFLAMTGGVSWGQPASLTKEMGFLHWFVFGFFIFFTFFSVLNIVTGVFVDGAIQQANSDRSIRLMQQQAQNKEYVESLMELLNHLDVDESGFITRDEWEAEIHDENVTAHMLLLGVNAGDAERLFKLLDTGNDGVISIEEFVEGMQRLRGPAQSMDLHILISRINYLMAQTEHFFASLTSGDVPSGKMSMAPPKGLFS